jgi:hypothetical protein
MVCWVYDKIALSVAGVANFLPISLYNIKAMHENNVMLNKLERMSLGTRKSDRKQMFQLLHKKVREGF